MTSKHILLPTDLSVEAQRALAPALGLAQAMGAKVTLLHAVHMLTEAWDAGGLGAPMSPPNYDIDRKSAEFSLAETVKGLHSDLDISTDVELSTNVAKTIAQYADEHDVSMIALSTHGRSGIRRLVLGSVAEGVVRNANVPVLCFPLQKSNPEDKGVNIKHILLTTDLSKEALRPFEPVLELAKSLGSRVTVLHVVPELMAIPHGTPLAPPLSPPDLPEQISKARGALEAQCASLENVGVKAISHESPAKGVVEFAKKNDVDLIALSTHGRTGFKRFALGSVAEEVLRRSPVPVLSFHRTEE